MAAELWNRVNIPFPSAVSCVRIRFTSSTGVNVKSLLAEIEKVLKLIRSEILQTEIRVLYELLYILNNSFRGNKTFKGLQQVEQCINRLKRMNLDGALLELTKLCPNKFQRLMGIKAGECEVPSQPMLEWLCLKVLGAAKLMSCTLNRCRRAFSLSKQQMKWEEFVILNVVITSMLSRLWVIFRGILCSLSTLYQQLLELLKEVAKAQPMPFLTDLSLPADVAHFLGSSDVFLIVKRSTHGPHTEERKKKKQQKTKRSSVLVQNQGQTKKVKEDLGEPVKRGLVADTDMKPFLKVSRNFTKGKPFLQNPHKAKRKQKFKKQVREAATFTEMKTCLEEMILWCKSQKMNKEKCLLAFVQLKCHKMKCLEAAGYNVQRKLKTFRPEACWALSPQGSVPKTCQSSAAMRRNARLRTPLHLLWSRFKASAVRTGRKTKWMTRKRKMTELSMSELSGDDQGNRTMCDVTSHTSEREGHDDIDDIFASVGL